MLCFVCSSRCNSVCSRGDRDGCCNKTASFVRRAVGLHLAGMACPTTGVARACMHGCMCTACSVYEPRSREVAQPLPAAAVCSGGEAFFFFFLLLAAAAATAAAVDCLGVVVPEYFYTLIDA